MAWDIAALQPLPPPGDAPAAPATERGELAAAARQFEALVVERMLEAMRATVPDDGPLRGQNEDLYREMLDREFAGAMVERQGYGLADALLRQLSPPAGEAAASEPAAVRRALAAYRSASPRTG